jgi:hypothetical protein
MIVKNQRQEIDTNKQNIDTVSMASSSRDIFKSGLKEINFRTAALLQSCGSCRGGKVTAPNNADKSADKNASVVLAA